MDVRQVRLKMAEFDAIIAVYRRTQFLQKLLSALRATPSLGRLIVVDNGNDDPTSAEIKRTSDGAGATLIVLDRNLNYGEALNRAMLETNAPTVLIAHSDSLPAPGCLETMLREADAHDAVMPYTNCSHVPGAVIEMDGREYCTLRTPAAKSRVVAITLANDVMSSVSVPAASALVDSVDTFFLLIRREVALSLGSFGENIFHRDSRMDDLWWRAGRNKFNAVIAGGAFCFHYGRFTVDGLFPDGVIARTNDLILSDIGDKEKGDPPDVSDDLRNSVLRFDIEIRRAADGPVFGKPIHLIHVGKPSAADFEGLRGIFEYHSIVMPEDGQAVYDSIIQECQTPWIMVLKSGERFHPAALPSVKRLTNEPYDAVEFPFMMCSTDGSRSLLSRKEDRYPFGQIRLFRKDSGCRISSGGEVTAEVGAALRRADRLFGEAVTQHIFQVGSWSGKWLNVCPRDIPMSMSGGAVLPTISVPANGDRLSIAIGVPSLGAKKPIHPTSHAASFEFRDALAMHPSISRVDCYDGEWQGRPADNDRVYAIREDHHAFLSVDESRPPPSLPGCASMCWITTSRFAAASMTPTIAAAFGYDKYFVSSRRFRDEMGELGCDAEFLMPSVLRGSRRQFSRSASRCQIGMILRAIPADWDTGNLLEAMSRLRDMNCLVFGHGWENLAAIRREISDMPREARARLVGFLDEVVPLIGQSVAVGKESMLFSGMQCLLHIPCPQDAAWGFVPHSVCGALAAGTPAVLLDEKGQFDPKDFGDAPVYVEKTASRAAHRAVEIASMSFDDLEILSERALAWASDNTHEHRVATILSSLAVRPEDRSDRTRPALLVCGGPLDDRTMDLIRFQSGLRGINVVQFESGTTESGKCLVEFTLGDVVLRFSSATPMTPSQADGMISALG